MPTILKLNPISLAEAILGAATTKGVVKLGCQISYDTGVLTFKSKGTVKIKMEHKFAKTIQANGVVLPNEVSAIIEKAMSDCMSNASAAHVFELEQMLASNAIWKQSQATMATPTMSVDTKVINHEPGSVVQLDPHSSNGDVMSVAEIAKAVVVHMDVAEKLYQPVQGTTAGSKYFLTGKVLTATGIVKVAARYKEGMVSVRVAGPGLAGVTKDLGEVGLTGKGGYFSNHFAVKSKNMAQRVLAGVNAVISPVQLLPMPDASMIFNKGA